MLHHKRKGPKARHRLFMEKAGNQSIQQLLKYNAEQPKKLTLGEEKEKRGIVTNSGINGYSRIQCNQLRINVREREKVNKLIQLTTLTVL